MGLQGIQILTYLKASIKSSRIGSQWPKTDVKVVILQVVTLRRISMLNTRKLKQFMKRFGRLRKKLEKHLKSSQEELKPRENMRMRLSNRLTNLKRSFSILV